MAIGLTHIVMKNTNRGLKTGRRFALESEQKFTEIIRLTFQFITTPCSPQKTSTQLRQQRC